MKALSSLQVNRKSGETLVAQIVRHVEEAASSGRLPYGTKLPSVRDLAYQLQVSCSCAAHAYEILTSRGITHAKPGSGHFVSCKPFATARSAHLGAKAGASRSGERFLSSDARGQAREPAFFADLGPDGLAPTLCALPEVGAGLRHVFQAFRDGGDSALRRGQGMPSLRRLLGSDLENRGLVGLDASNILLFSNERQALTFLLSQICAADDDVVAIEEPASSSIREAVMASGRGLVTLPRRADLADEGWASLCEERLFESRPRAVIVMPNFHDPTGTVLSPFCRNRLIALASRIGFRIIELDPFAHFAFGEVFQTPLCALDGLTQSVYVTGVGTEFGESFSLTAVCAREPFAQTLRRQKTMSFGVPSHFEEDLLADLWALGIHRRQVNKLERVLLQKRDHLLGMLSRLAPPASVWSLPLGGLHLWFGFPQGINTTRLAARLQAKGINLAPGSDFGSDPDLFRYMRLNFSHFEPEVTHRALTEVFAECRQDLDGSIG